MNKFLMAVIASAFMAFTAIAYAAEKPTAGLVLVGPKSDGGWSMRHYQGMQESGYEFDYVESVSETDSARVFNRLARKHDVVFGTSFGYMDPMLETAKKFPNVKFMHATGFKTAENMNNYNCRLFQARYLAGVAAGKLTKTNKIGVVGSHPIPEIISNINAMTLGAQSVNPNIEVNIIWINSWFDPAKDMSAARALLDWGADVSFTTTDSPSVVVVAEEKSTPERPLWGMGNDAPMNSYGPTRYATGPMFNWDVYYSHVMKSVEDGTWKVDRPFWGMKEGCVGLSPWGPNVPMDVQILVEEEYAKFVSEEYDESYPFSQGYLKQNGTVVYPGVGRAEIDSMDHYVHGVITPMN